MINQKLLELLNQFEEVRLALVKKNRWRFYRIMLRIWVVLVVIFFVLNVALSSKPLQFTSNDFIQVFPLLVISAFLAMIGYFSASMKDKMKMEEMFAKTVLPELVRESKYDLRLVRQDNSKTEDMRERLEKLADHKLAGKVNETTIDVEISGYFLLIKHHGKSKLKRPIEIVSEKSVKREKSIVIRDQRKGIKRDFGPEREINLSNEKDVDFKAFANSPDDAKNYLGSNTSRITKLIDYFDIEIEMLIRPKALKIWGVMGTLHFFRLNQLYSGTILTLYKRMKHLKIDEAFMDELMGQIKFIDDSVELMAELDDL